MFIALLVSLLFTFTIGTLAAKSKPAGRLLIPLIDILQSVPVLGFLSITVVGFINLFHGSLLGPECASIFAIFTAQAWNMTLSFYQSLRTVPPDLIEASHMLHLSSWQRFWRVEVPFAMPALLWNTMMSMSASWFFVVASEAINVSNQNITLPGVGSYISVAIAHADKQAIIYAIITMLVVILLYDQLLFRPLISWSHKFRAELSDLENAPRSRIAQLLKRSYLFKYLGKLSPICLDAFINFPAFRRRSHSFSEARSPLKRWLEITWYCLISLVLTVSGIFLIQFILEHVTFADIIHVLFLGLITGLRVITVLFFCTIIWVPLGVFIGMRPRLASLMQPIMQFLAAFPANLLFPLVVYLIVKYRLNPEIWITPLMFIGTQWYVAFNIIAATRAIPKDLHQAINNFNVRGWLRWRRFLLPAIFPYYITGAITAAGGAWNVSIVAEFVSWGTTKLQTTGLGSYITQYTTIGDFPKIALGISVMCIYVLILNRLVWRPLYNLAEKRYRLG